VELAEASGLQPTYLSDIERGVPNPSYELLTGLAEALGVKLSEIVASCRARLAAAANRRAVPTVAQCRARVEISLSLSLSLD